MFGNGESGTGGVLLGNVSLGKAVKVLRGMSRLCDVRLGKVRQSRRCKFWHGEFWRVWPGLGSHGELSQGGAMPVMDWRGSHGGAG